MAALKLTESYYMKIYISADLEGINGICHSSQTQPTERGFERAVALLHQEVNAVIRGARLGGAREIVVNDAHWDMRNLESERLEPGTTLISGWQKPFSMVSGCAGAAGLASVASGPFDAAYFVGYHAMSGTARGVLSHTYRAKVFLDVSLNGQPVGETGLNAAACGWWGVPLAFLSGDDAVCEEAVDLLGPLECVTVKKAVSRYSAVFAPQEDVIAQLEAGAARALENKNRWRLFRPPSPSTLELTMLDPAMADGAELLPGVRRLSDRQIAVSHNNFSVLFNLMLAIGAIGEGRRDRHF